MVEEGGGEDVDVGVGGDGGGREVLCQCVHGGEFGEGGVEDLMAGEWRG